MGRFDAMKKKIRIGLNLLIAVSVILSWLFMVFYAKTGILTGRGVRSLRYFTVLSNLFAAAAAIVWLFCQARGRNPKTAAVLKYAAAVSVGLTFLVVLVFLGPRFGFAGMYGGYNLWMHLLVPLMAMGEFIFLNDTPMTLSDNAWAVAPMLLYGVYYVGNAAVNGIGKGWGTNDWYGFLTWGWGWGAFIFAAIAGITFLLGLLLRKANALVLRKKSAQA